MEILCLMALIASTQSMITNKDTFLDKNGIVTERSARNVILIKESIIVTLVYDVSPLKSMFNVYIEELDSISSNIGNNDCLMELLSGARKKRFLIRDFIENLNNHDRVKRQAFSTLMGVTGLISLGLSSVEAFFVNERVEDMKKRLGQNEQNINILEQAMNFNSVKINELIRAQEQSHLVLTSIKNQVLKNIEEINKLKLEMMCVNAKLTFTNLSLRVDNMLTELKNILNYHFDSGMISYETKTKICNDIFGKGLRVSKNCNHFNLVEEVEFFMANLEKLIIFIKLPILNTREPFEILTLRTLPIKINNEYYKISNWEQELSLAVGKRYRSKVNLNKCKKYNRHVYCNAVSEFRLKTEQKTCVGAIVNNNSNVLKFCNMKKIKFMEDTFVKTNSGKYYYSVKSPLKFEVLCKDDLQNDQFVLDGLGSVTIKVGCNGKLDNILLIGTHNYELNTTYQIDTKAMITYLNNPDILNNSMIDIKANNFSVSNQLKFDTYDNNNMHYYVIYTVMTINMLILVTVVVVICIKQVYVVSHKVDLNSKNQMQNIELKNLEKNLNDQPITQNTVNSGQNTLINSDPIYQETDVY